MNMLRAGMIVLVCCAANADAEEPQFQTEEITFRSVGGISLSATLTLPKGPGPFPAIVLLGGSERLSRSAIYNWSEADSFVSHGVAVFSFDSPGTGKSQGDRWLRTHRERTEDALAAMRALEERDDIKNDLIGLYGASEGGVVVFRAASQAKNVAFGITISAPAIPDFKHLEAAVRMLCEGTGLKGAQLEKLVTFNLLTGDLVRSQNRPDYADLEKTIAKWNDPSWNQLLSILQKKGDHNLEETKESFIEIAQKWEGEEWFRKNGVLRGIHQQVLQSAGLDLSDLKVAEGEQDSARTHVQYTSAIIAAVSASDTPLTMVMTKDASRDEDPVSFLRKIDCPLLCVYGENDQEMSDYPALVRQALTDSEHKDFVVKVLSGADHQLNVTEGKQTFRHRDLEKFVLDWVQGRVRKD